MIKTSIRPLFYIASHYNDTLGLPKSGWDRYALQNQRKNNVQIKREPEEFILCMIFIFIHLHSQIIVRILLQKSLPTSVSVTFSQIYFLLKKAMNIHTAFLSEDPTLFMCRFLWQKGISFTKS
jgi:hypothetical protein